MFNRRIGLVASIAALMGGLARGADALTQIAVANDNFRQSFSARYGNSHRNSKAAQQKRAARKRRNIRARASKRA